MKFHANFQATFIEKSREQRTKFAHFACITFAQCCICTAVVYEVKSDHHSKFSSLSNWKGEAWKNQGCNRIRTRDLCEYWCDALPTELWSHTLGVRSIYWVHIFPCSEVMWSIYEIIHICTAVVYEVKSDHHSKFSNLSNWKWEARKNQGFNGIQTRDLRDTGAMTEQASHFQWLKLENLLRWSLFTSYTTAVQIWIISYILHITSLHGKIWTQ